jgi:hypothetical protein
VRRLILKMRRDSTVLQREVGTGDAWKRRKQIGKRVYAGRMAPDFLDFVGDSFETDGFEGEFAGMAS